MGCDVSEAGATRGSGDVPEELGICIYSAFGDSEDDPWIELFEARGKRDDSFFTAFCVVCGQMYEAVSFDEYEVVVSEGQDFFGAEAGECKKFYYYANVVPNAVSDEGSHLVVS